MSSDPDIRWRALLVPVYGPTLLAAIGMGAALPIVALAATALGASPVIAALIVALAPAGHLLADLPAGLVAARIGERKALLLASGCSAAALVLAYFAWSPVVLGIAIFAEGCTAAVFNLARHTWMTGAIPARIRARALSSLGGTFRIGTFVGPFIGAGLIALFGLPAVFLFAAATTLGAGLLTLTMRELPAPVPTPDTGGEQVRTREIVVSHRRVLLTVGTGVLLLSLVRGARQSILPLWAESQALTPEVISVIIGIAAAFELILVYPGGALMDRFGRASVVVPALILLGGGLAVLPLMHSALTICVAASITAAGNGLSSGVILTTGSDAAPQRGRHQFLSVWRLIADVGALSGPALVALTALASLTMSAVSLGVVCVAGALWWSRLRPLTRQPARK